MRFHEAARFESAQRAEIRRKDFDFARQVFQERDVECAETLQELHQVGMSLEEVFIRVVAGEEAQEQAVVAAPEPVEPDDAVAPESD